MSGAVDSDALTRDRLLGGRVTILQPAAGYRVAVDPVMLAAAAPVLRPGGRMLDIGCGVGAASFCYLRRAPDGTVIGLEADGEIAALARRNAELNGLEDRFGSVCADVADWAGLNLSGRFDQVISNPPYLAAGSAAPSPHPGRRSASVESRVTLEAWVHAALDALRHKGRLTLIQRADRLHHVMAALAGRAGEIEILPLWPRTGVAAKRVVVRARKGVSGGATLGPGLVLHGDGRKYTAAAEAVLRDMAPLG